MTIVRVRLRRSGHGEPSPFFVATLFESLLPAALGAAVGAVATLLTTDDLTERHDGDRECRPCPALSEPRAGRARLAGWES
jgi:hypothetical protein